MLAHAPRQPGSWLIWDVGQKNMTAADILTDLFRIQPSFRAYWEHTNHFVGDDGSFTACGVFSQFTNFFRAHHEKMKKDELQAIAALISQCEKNESLREAAYACFLENIAGDPPDLTLSPFLSTQAIEFCTHWRTAP